MTIQKLFNYWIGKRRSGFYIFLEFMFAGMYFIGVMIDSNSFALSVMIKQTGFLGFLFGAILFLIHLNLYANRRFLKHFEDVDHLPKKQIWHVNSFCMSIFLGLCLILLPLVAFGLEPLWKLLGQWFAEHARLEDAIYPALYMEMEPVDAPDMEALFGEVKPTPAWIKLLDRIFRIFGSILIVMIILFMIQKFFSKLWTWIIKPRQFDDDEKIYLTPALSIFSKEKAEPKQSIFHTFRSYDEKIRRQYRREILSHTKKRKLSLPCSASPSELEQLAGLEQNTLHELYEKARYSKEPCTREDWDKL